MNNVILEKFRIILKRTKISKMSYRLIYPGSTTILLLLLLTFTFPCEQMVAQTKKEWTIVIDPGHGGNDPGAIGGEIKEKDITLAIALKLNRKLSNLENTKVILTRHTDEAVELHKRAKKANENKADLFISIHCNSVESVKPYGAETWLMGLHKSKANLEVARAENAVILLEDDYKQKYDGFDPNSPEAEIIFSLYQNTYLDQSVELASLVQKELRANAQRFDRGVKQAGFLVLYKINMPGILVETGFLSNENERKYLASDAGQITIASSIYNAIINYREKVEGKKPGEKPVSDIKSRQTVVSSPSEKPKPETSTDKIAVPDTTNQRTNNIAEQHIKVNGNETPVPEENNKKNKKDSVPELYFAVQLFTASKPKEPSDPVFKDFKDVHYYFMDGSYRYVAGYFKTQQEANDYKTDLQKTSFQDAFVVAFYKGNRISLTEAGNLMKK